MPDKYLWLEYPCDRWYGRITIQLTIVKGQGRWFLYNTETERIEKITDEDKEKYKTRKYFINLFRDIKRIITPYEKSGNLYNRLFVDEKRNAYMLNKRNRLEQLNKENFNAIIKDNKINEKRLN